MALSSPILRKLRLFNSGLLPLMLKKCKCPLVSTTITVALCAILQTYLPLLMLYFAMRLLCIGITLRSLLCAPCALHYAALLFLPLLDYTKPFCIESDGFDTAVGGVLVHERASVHQPNTLCCKTLTSSE